MRSLSMHRYLILLAGIACAGCDNRQFTLPPPQPAKPKIVKKVVTPAKPRPTSRGKQQDLPSAEDLQKELDIIARAYDATQQPRRPGSRPAASFPSPGLPRTAGSGGGDQEAFALVAAAIKESVELGPTLVVWLIDRTPSAQRSMTSATQAVLTYYESPEVKNWMQGDNAVLTTAVVAFDEQASFVLDPPARDAQQVQSAITSIQATTSGRELTCTALKLALEKYQGVRTQDRREVLLVAITDEAGDDRAAAEDVVALARRSAIPIYVIGLPAPWGQTNPSATDPKAPLASADDSQPTYGPESLASERVDIFGWGGYSLQASDLIDSGFGPFALERVCRGSRGRFIALRSAGLGGGSWPAPTSQHFDDRQLNKYAPDYVSEAEYQKLLSANKARSALVAAAGLPRVVVEGYPESRFVKGTEAQNAKRFSQSQQFAAKNLPLVDRLYDALAPGEGDRDKLQSARWEAEYDLAMGRVCAVKARLDGYNSMIAALKRGKSFSNPDSREWILEPSDSFETESTIKRTAERAKIYLERVVKEHPGTPWARIAAEELRTPFGWTWREA